MTDYNVLHNRAVWFDIPAKDLERAAAFYAAVLAIGVSKETFGGFSFCVLEHKEGNGGCLVPDEADITGGGVLLYLNVNGRIRDAVAEVVPLGGTVIQPIHPIGEQGFRAIILDSEGNRVALHSMSDA